MAEKHDSWRMETIAVHGGCEPEAEAGSITVPIYTSSAFEFESAEAAAQMFLLQREGNVYSRLQNPTNTALEQRLAMLEGGSGALATASGQAAVALTVMTLCRAGDEVVVSSSIYGGVYNLFRNTLAHLGIKPHFVCPGSADAFAEAINGHTKLVYAESLANPRLDMPDLAAVARVAHDHGVPFVLDNTVPTASLLRPFECGVDIVVYSATKYLCGHGTVIGGAIVDSGRFDWNGGHFPAVNEPDPSNNNIRFTDAFGEKAFITACRAQAMREVGACISPFNAFLLIQGIETLPLRMARHSENAAELADFLAQHPAVDWVLYPGRPDHPTHSTAKRYLSGGYAGMIAFGVRGGLPAGRKLVENVELIRHAANLGDARSLVVHPASTTHSQMPAEARAAVGIGDEFIRLSVGLEHPEDLMADLDQALT